MNKELLAKEFFERLQMESFYWSNYCNRAANEAMDAIRANNFEIYHKKIMDIANDIKEDAEDNIGAIFNLCDDHLEKLNIEKKD